MTTKDQILKEALLKAFEEIRPIFGDQTFIDLKKKYEALKHNKYSEADLRFKLSTFSKLLDKYKNK